MCGRVGELWVNVRVNSEWTPFEEIRKTRLATGLTPVGLGHMALLAGSCRC